MTFAIKVENLSKKYIISHQKNQRYQYKTLQETIFSAGRSALQRVRHPLSNTDASEQEEFWALKDINFEINQGDRVGIIGRNGAGKSTLLKILSRITSPTTGKITLNGRVSSLLEVGTGFHPELTGRENIYLNGAILGMRSHEIRKKFDEIVAFAEVEKFLDTPVKRYSSGMYVRLAFAVAAHLEPEILIVDEVLAVGDAEFQKKCLGKMEEVSNEGRTVIFVSHNMGALQKLCNKAILIDKGKFIYGGDVNSVISKYVENLSKDIVVNFENNCLDQAPITFDKVWLENSKNIKTNSFLYGEPFFVCFTLMCNENIDGISFHLGINSLLGERIFTSDSEEFVDCFEFHKNKKYQMNIKYDSIILMPGMFKVGKLMSKKGKINEIQTQLDVMTFEVSEVGFEGKKPFVKAGLVSGVSEWFLQ